MPRSFSITAAVGLSAALQASLQAHDSMIPHVHPSGETLNPSAGIVITVATAIAVLFVCVLFKVIHSIAGRSVRKAT
ncbi:MAG: hypothetical protein ACE361_14690 [Aureliella sp.]